MSPEIEGIIVLALGLVFIIIFFGISQRAKKLSENGVDVEGVIFEVDWERSGGTSFARNSASAYPVVRYVTKDGTWITRKSSQSGFMIKVGQKVKLKYNPENPEDFIITSGQFKWTSYIFLFVGFICFGIGVFKLIDYVSV